MYIPKQYGASKLAVCPFCKRQATTSNEQGIPTCIKHKEDKFPEMKCICGSWLELRQGKYGPFFTCMSCGIINMKKAMEINNMENVVSWRDL